MIFAIEGPDCSGKSTLFKELQNHVNAIFVHLRPLPKITAEAMQRELDVWEALYDPARLYICDRHIITSDRIYAEYYGRKMLTPSFLEAKIRIVYLQVSESDLVQRHNSRGELIQDPKDYNEVLRLYETMVQQFRHIIHENIVTTVRWIHECR